MKKVTRYYICINQQTMNLYLRRVVVLLFTFVIVFGSAASCNFFDTAEPAANLRYGILKNDPKIYDKGYAFVNTVKNFKNNTISNGLGPQSGVKLIQLGKDRLAYISKNKGLFKTENGGRDWQRVYIYTLKANSNAEFDQQIAKNDELKISDVSYFNNDNFYVSGIKNEISYLFRTNDGGASFTEVYNTEANGKKVVIEQVLTEVKADRTNTVYISTSGGGIFRTDDAGSNWKNINIPNITNDKPLQLGFLSQYDNRMFVLYRSAGLYLSENGDTFTKKDVQFGKNSDNDYFFTNNARPDKIIQSKGSRDLIIIADKGIYITSNLESEFKQIKIPVEPTKINISDIAIDPKEGVNRLILSADNKLFESRDGGISWSVNDKIKQDKVAFGNIGTIIIDQDDSTVVYLMLIDPTYTRDDEYNLFNFGI